MNQDIRDYLKDQTKNVKTPDSLQPEAIEKMLEGKAQKKKGMSRKTISILVSAACFLLIIVAGAVMIPSIQKEEKTTTVADNKTDSYEWFYDKIMDGYEEPDRGFFMDFSATEKTTGASDMSDAVYENVYENDGTGAASSGADYSETDVQVDGVMEGDIVKTDGTYIYTISAATTGSRIHIYLANEGTPKEISEFFISNERCNEMYLHGDNIVLVTSTWEEENNTAVHIYDIKDKENPMLVKSLNQSGDFSTARVNGNYLYTFSNYRVDREDAKKEKPETYVPKTNGFVMPFDRICPIGEDTSNTYMVMTSLNLSEPTDYTDTISTLGASNVYYVSNENIYVVNFSWKKEKTGITKYSYKDGTFARKESVYVDGRIENSYYMHEYNKYFCFVYTSYSSDVTKNGLCVLDENLKQVGEISNLGLDEEIYASYYMDNMAYFVTYRETDPVFAVDFSDPTNPILKSELKLPGFSSYLHSFGEDLLLGIGSQEKGFGTAAKFSIFRIGEDQSIKQESKMLTDYWAYHIADTNHKAVFVDEERQIFGIAIEDGEESEVCYYVFSYEDKEIKQLAAVPVDVTLDDVRGVRIGDYFYVVSVGDKIDAYDMREWEKVVITCPVGE